jgi:hypothetical protein
MALRRKRKEETSDTKATATPLGEPNMSLQVLEGPTIVAGQSMSNVLDCNAGNIVRVNIPPEFTGSQLTFRVSTEGQHYHDVYDMRGEEVTLNAVPGTTVYTQNPVLPVGFLKFRSGTSKKPSNQSAEVKFSVVIQTPPESSSGTTQYWLYAFVPGYGWMWLQAER